MFRKFLSNVLWHFLYHLNTFWNATKREWKNYRQTKEVPVYGINISLNLLEMATEENGVNKYPTPADLTAERFAKLKIYDDPEYQKLKQDISSFLDKQ